MRILPLRVLVSVVGVTALLPGCEEPYGDSSASGLGASDRCHPVHNPDACDLDEDGVRGEVDCDDDDARVGALLFAQNFHTNTGDLSTTPQRPDEWNIGGGFASNTRGGQQVLLAQNFLLRDTVTFAEVAAHGLERKCRNCSYRATQYNNGGGHALWMPGFYDGNRRHRVRMFFDDVAVFRFDRDEGEATLQGVAVVVDLGGGPGTLGEAWRVNMTWQFRGEGAHGEGHGGPKRELARHQPQTITDQWMYFDLVEGALEEIGGEGYVSFVQAPADSKYPMQVGPAASGKNTRYGAATWLSFTHDNGSGAVTNGVGDLNIDLYERDRFRAGILARANLDADQDEGFHGYRCAVARNSQVDCHQPGRFVQLSAFLDQEEDEVFSECDQSPGECAPNTTFDQLARVERSDKTDFLAGDSAHLSLWAVGDQLSCEFRGRSGEHIVASAADDRFGAGTTGLSVLNALSDFESLKVCEAFRL